MEDEYASRRRMIRCVAAALVTVRPRFVPGCSSAGDRPVGGLRTPANASIFVLGKQGAEHRGTFLPFDDQELVMRIGTASAG